MGLGETKYEFQVDGMTCNGCEVKIERKLKQTMGIISVNADYSNSLVKVVFDKAQTDLSEIQKTITKLGYKILKSSQVQNKSSQPMSKSVKNTVNTSQGFKGNRNKSVSKSNKFNLTDFLLLVLSVYVISMVLKRLRIFEIFDSFPQAAAGASYIVLFNIGLLTSVHCIAMCGGINLSQCVSEKIDGNVSRIAALKPSFLYNFGRVVSYTIIGGVFGAIGSAISISPFAKGIVAFIAGIFMIIMGINMLNVFPWLRKLTPKMPKFLIGKLGTGANNSSFYVGLLNGIMPCGPLQAMQIYALTTGSLVKGALSMFFFSLGTVPLMFSFGALSSLLTKKFTTKMMSVSAVLVIFMGIFMFNNGMGLAGFSLPVFSMPSGDSSTKNSVSAQIDENKNLQIVSFDLSRRGYEPITVKAGLPVKWIINADASQITGCNNEIIIPKYNISKKLVPGENIIEFTPDEVGKIPYSCWMGMIRSSITVE